MHSLYNITSPISDIYATITAFIPKNKSYATTVAKVTLAAIALILLFDAWPSYLCGVGVITSLTTGGSFFCFSTAFIITRKKDSSPVAGVNMPSPVESALEVDESDLVLLGPASSSNLIALKKTGFWIRARTYLLERKIPTFGADMIWDQLGRVSQPMKSWEEIAEGGLEFVVDIANELELLRKNVDDPDPEKIRSTILRICTVGNKSQIEEAKSLLSEVQRWYTDYLAEIEEDLAAIKAQETALKTQIGLIGQEIKGDLPTARGNKDVDPPCIVGVKRSNETVCYGLLFQADDKSGNCVVSFDQPTRGDIGTKEEVPLKQFYIFNDLQERADYDDQLWKRMYENYLFLLRNNITSYKRELGKIREQQAFVNIFPLLFDQVESWRLSKEETSFFKEPFPLIWGVRNYSQNMRLGSDIPVVYTRPEHVDRLQSWFNIKRCKIKVMVMKRSTPLLNRLLSERFRKAPTSENPI